MAAEAIGYLIERITDLANSQFKLLFGVTDELVTLRLELEMMQAFLIDAETKLEAGDERLRTILRQIKELSYDVEDFIDSVMEQQQRRKRSHGMNIAKKIGSLLSCVVHTHQASTRIGVLEKRIKKGTKTLGLYQVGTNVEVCPRRVVSYPYSFSDGIVVGIEDDVEQLVQELINDRNENDGSGYFYGYKRAKALVIVGMGGSGKTTLARKIYCHSMIEYKFDCQAWVCVSQVWKSEDLLREIFRQTTGKSTTNLTNTEIMDELNKFLKHNSCLLVLDDVWEKESLRQIMPPVISNSTKFIITTRNREVVAFPDVGCFVHEARRLNQDQSWELFKKIALCQHNDDQHRMALGKEMLRKCDGLPLAIISLAGLLSTKENVRDWEKVNHNVSSKIIRQDGPVDYGRVGDMLALSYYDLNYTLKSCFLYMGLFPEDAEIPTDMLIRMWIAEGFIKSLYVNESVEDVANQCLDDLVQRCLLQISKTNYVGKVKAVRIHDLLRDLAIRKAKEQCFLDIQVPLSDFGGNDGAGITTHPRRLGVVSGGTAIESDIPHLRSLVRFLEVPLFDKIGIHSLGVIWKKYKLLRVLNLSISTQSYDSVIFMPSEIGRLRHLRYLEVRTASPIQLPLTVENLRTLLSLTCIGWEAHSDYRFIPSLRHMKHLRHLRLSGKVCPYNRKETELQDLKNLQVLWNIKAGPWLKHLSPTVQKLYIQDIQSLQQLEYVYQCLSNVKDCLHTLKLGYCFYGVELKLEKLKHCKQLQKLILWGEIEQNQNMLDDLVFSPCLLKLELHYTKLETQDAIMSLGYLKVLKLEKDAYMGCRLCFDVNSCPHLEDLWLGHLPNLVELTVIEGALPCLKSLTIDECYELKALPQGLKGITTLQQLKILSMSEEFNSRLRHREDGDRGEDFHIIQNIPSVHISEFSV